MLIVQNFLESPLFIMNDAEKCAVCYYDCWHLTKIGDAFEMREEHDSDALANYSHVS